VGGAYIYIDPTPSKNFLRIELKLTLPAWQINGLAQRGVLHDKANYGKSILSCNVINALAQALCWAIKADATKASKAVNI